MFQEKNREGERGVEEGVERRWSIELKEWTKLWTSQIKMSSDSEKHQRKSIQVLYLWIIDASVSGCWFSPFARRIFSQSNFQVENAAKWREKKIYDREDQAQDHVICSP